MNTIRKFLRSSYTYSGNKWTYLMTGGFLGGGVLLYTLEKSVKAAELEIHPPKLPWPHKAYFKSLDHASVRRGYEVYKSVCSACHSLRFVSYRELIGVTHTEEEAKAEAESVTVEDGPNDEGIMFKRPGKLSDRIPSPYPNEEAARFANNGAYPPDLTYIIPGRHGQEDYIFHYLTSYMDPPEGVHLREGQYYNPYFPGGATSMADPLYNEAIEYADGTKASKSQLAKDVSTFLKWTSEPEHDLRKSNAVKTIAFFSVVIPLCVYWKRHHWSSLKTRKIFHVPPKK